jgi:RNA ligase (TIGR02306 family)
MSERRLATIRRIAEINPIEGADSIQVARVDGWMCVVKKDDFKTDELVLYFEVDSWVPTELAPFLTKPGHSPKVFEEVQGERLRTVRLRGQLSQGLLLKLPDWPHAKFVEGMDLTELLGVLKWERALPENMRGLGKGNFPYFVHRTSQTRIQNIPEVLLDQETKYEISLKVDGSSITGYLKDGVVGVCSHNIDLKMDPENSGNAFIHAAQNSGIIKALEACGRNLAVQGELAGPGVQRNRAGYLNVQIYIFDIWDIDNQCYLPHIERTAFCEAHFLNHVPTLGLNFTLPELGITDMESILALPELINRTKFPSMPSIEGLVFKSADGATSFKVINNEYLLKNDG